MSGINLEEGVAAHNSQGLLAHTGSYEDIGARTESGPPVVSMPAKKLGEPPRRGRSSYFLEALMGGVRPNNEPEYILGLRCLEAVSWFYDNINCAGQKLNTNTALAIMASYLAGKYGYTAGP